MKTPLLALGILSASISSLCAQSLFTSSSAYLAPSWRGTANAQFQNWDYFYSANYNYSVTTNGVTTSYSDGINYPDMGVKINGQYLDAPYGTGGSAPGGYTVPKNAPADAFAYWDTRNATLAQVGTTTAIMAGAINGTGNIYSFAAATAYELKNTTPYTLGTVVLQWQTGGSFIDFSTVRLVSPSGTEYLPSNLIKEYRQGAGAMGGIDNRVAAQWNLTGLNLTGYTIKFAASGSSNSFQELLLDTNNTYTEVVPSTRSWTATSGNWSTAANWGGAIPTVAGNVTFASGSGVVLDGASRTVSELKLTAPTGFAISSTGGAALQINTGITATPAAPASYTINSPVVINSLNFTEVGAGSQVTLSGSVTGTAGIYKLGDGALRLTGNMNLPSAVTVSGGSLEIGGTGTIGEISLLAGTRLVVNGTLASGAALTLTSATLSGSGTVNRSILLDTGDILSPGNSVGTLTTVAETWSGGGTFRLEVANAAGAAGTGWDLLSIVGALTLNASAGSFTLDLDSIGTALNFNPAQDYLWKFASATAGITGFNANLFHIDSSGFANGLNGSFSVSRTGNDLFLNYAAVPEPNSASLCILGVAFAALWRNRRFISGQDRPE